MVKIYNFLCTEAKTIREKVFMEEQGFKNEFDEYDEMVPHALLFMAVSYTHLTLPTIA